MHRLSHCLVLGCATSPTWGKTGDGYPAGTHVQGAPHHIPDVLQRALRKITAHQDLKHRTVARIGTLREEEELRLALSDWSPDTQRVVVQASRYHGSTRTMRMTQPGAHVDDRQTKQHLVKAFEGSVTGFADNDTLIVRRRHDTPLRDTLERWPLDAVTSTPLPVEASVVHVLDAAIGGPWVFYLGDDGKDGLVLGATRSDGTEHRVVKRYTPDRQRSAWSLTASQDGSRVAAYSGASHDLWLRVMDIDRPRHRRCRIRALLGQHPPLGREQPSTRGPRDRREAWAYGCH